MPPRSKIDLLPDGVRQDLEQRLIASGFGGYRGLADWLEEQGFEIAKSTLHEWGQKFEDRVKQMNVAARQAQAIVAATPDDEGAMIEALQRLVSEKLFQAFMALNIDPEKISQQNLSALTRAVADLGRASVTQKKFMAEVKSKARTVADEVATEMKKGGAISDATIEQFRNRVLGIAEAPKGA